MKKLAFVSILVVVGCGSSPREVPALTAPLPPPAPASAAPPLAVAKGPAEPPSPRPEAAAYDGPTGGAVGDHAPLVGGELATARGRVAIVHVFASWCAPCARVLPALQAFHAKQGSSGVAVVAISVDDEEPPARKFASSFGVKFPVAWDGDKGIVDKWKPATMPTTYVVDRAGIVRFVHAGFQDGDVAVFTKEAEGL